MNTLIYKHLVNDDSGCSCTLKHSVDIEMLNIGQRFAVIVKSLMRFTVSFLLVGLGFHLEVCSDTADGNMLNIEPRHA